MRESEKTEFKRTFVGDLNKEVIAFANCGGGEIFVGIDDDGGVCGVDDINDMQLRCTAHIKNTIRPDIMNFVRVEPVVVDGKNVLKIIVCRGSAAPYYIAGKGIRPEGVYVRRGTASSPATQTEILNMIRDTSVAYEDMRSIEQNLTFVRAGQEFDRAGLPFGDAQKRSLGIVGADGCFTNLGYLLSDQCAQNIKFAVFDGYEKEVFRDRHEFGGSLFGQIEDTMRAIDIYNRQSSPKTDGLLRQDRRDYPEEAIREALLNAVVHRDYAMGGYTLISMFDDRIEFVSLGGLMRGVEMEDIMLGVSYLRNKKLADVFYRLHLIEAYGTGLAKIKASYTGQAKQPVFESTQNAFKVVLYKTAAAVVQTRGLSPYEEPIIAFASGGKEFARKDVEALLGVSAATATRVLSNMVEKGALIRVGEGRGVRYSLRAARK